jgi:hypothetical protein
MIGLCLVLDGIFTQVKLAIDNSVGNWTEPGAGAGPRNAIATVDLKQGAMGCAHNVVATSVEKTVGHPVEFKASVGAAVAIEVELTRFAHGENAVEFVELKALCAVSGNIVDGAKSLWVAPLLGVLWC